MWWLHALKLWNGLDTKLNVEHKDVWAIPKKGTKAMNEVRIIAGKTKHKVAEPPKPVKKEKKQKKTINIKI